MRRGEVLELVDEQHPARTLGRSTGVDIGEQHPECAVDLTVEVDRALTGQGRLVVGQHVGQAGDVTRVPRLDLDRVDEPEPDQDPTPRSTAPTDRCCVASAWRRTAAAPDERRARRWSATYGAAARTAARR